MTCEIILQISNLKVTRTFKHNKILTHDYSIFTKYLASNWPTIELTY